tara:strand:- start:7403 stop:10495 length:3093 start_codon:yes stop_codon:yes gene_type:complete
MFYCITTASITGAAFRDAIFLVRFDKTYLPLMYVFIALIMAMAIEAYKKFTLEKDQITLITISGSIFSISLLLFQLYMPGWAIPVFYIWMEIVTILSIMQFWILAGAVFNSRQAKRLFPLIIAGGSISAITAGYSISPFVEFFGSHNILYLTLLFLITSIAISHFIRPYVDEQAQFQPKEQKSRNIKFDPYLKAIAIMALCSAFISRIVDYQFKVMSSEVFPNQNELVEFFGSYYMYTGLATLFMQFFLTGYILTRFGILIGLIILPIALSIGSIGFLMAGTLLTIFITKFSDQVFKFSINNAIREILWLPLSIKKKQRSKPIIDGTLKSSIEGFAGLVIFSLVYFDFMPGSRIYLLSIITVLVTAIWIWNTFKLKKGYVTEIVRSIDNRQLNLDVVEFDVHDVETVNTLDKTLKDKDEFKQLFAIDILWTLPLEPWKGTIRHLFLNGSIAIKRGILELCWNQESILPDKLIKDQTRILDDITPYAIACANDRQIKGLKNIITDYLSHKNTSLAMASAVAILSQDLNNKEATQLIEHTLENGEQNNILEMIGFLKAAPHLVDRKHILKLFDSKNDKILNSVLTIVCNDPKLDYFDKIIKLLTVSTTFTSSERALEFYPKNQVSDRLLNIISDKESDQELHKASLRMIHNYHNKGTVRIILTFMNNPNLSLIEEASDALIKISKKHALDNVELLEINNNIETLAKRAYQLHRFNHDLDSDLKAGLIIDHINCDLAAITRIILKLGTLKEPDIPIETYIRYIESKDIELLPLVLELVESTFSSKIIRLLIPLIDPESDTLSFANEAFGQELISMDEMLIFWVENPHRWKTSIAIQFLLNKENTTILRSINWSRISEKLLEIALFNDHEKNYLDRNFLNNKLPRKESQTMYSILEKTLLLKSVDLFETIPGEILSKIARISVEIETEESEIIFDEGDHGDSLFVIISGKINVTQNDNSIAVLGSGRCIGEMALLDQEPRSARATSFEDSILLKIHQEGFYELMASNPDIMKQIVKILTRRVRMMNKKLTNVLS